MERIDPGKAAAVWQRVQNTAQPKLNSRELPALIQEELTDTAVYQQLARKLQANPTALKLARQAAAHAQCLRGMYFLSAGEYPAPYVPRLPQESAELALRRCYGHTLSRLARYENLSADTEFGMVFSQLASQTRTLCLLLLELLGSLKKTV